MLILGISAFYHDSAAVLIKNGEILLLHKKNVFRIKHDSNFPYQAIKKCIDFCSLDLNKIDYFAFMKNHFKIR